MESNSGTKPPRKRRRRRPSPQRHHGPEAYATTALRALRELGRAIGVRQGLSPQDPLPISSIVLPVTVRLSDADTEASDADLVTMLVQGFESRLRDALESSRAFREGKVYCFFCSAPDCAHTSPFGPTDVFLGYTPNGKPEWQNFTNLCIGLGERRVELLYKEPPEVIALVLESSDLNARLLPGFGSDSMVFNVLGQVVAGLIPSDLDMNRPSQTRVALTFQFLETRVGAETPRLRLNILGLPPARILEAAAEAHPRESAERLRRTIAITREKLDVLGRRAVQAERRGQSLDLEEAVRPMLYRLKNDIERDFRIHAERTRHARQRHLGVDRPTSCAISDARNAPFERLFFDTARNTVVVLGPRGRAHIFSLEGLHVTSLQLEAGELERKNARARWVPLDRTRAESFVRTLARDNSEQKTSGKPGVAQQKARGNAGHSA